MLSPGALTPRQLTAEIGGVPFTTVAEALLARAADAHPALAFEGRTWSYAELVAESRRRAAWFERARRPAQPPHIGLLLDNVPDFVFWLGAAALSGAVAVGLNTTRRGDELAADVRHTDCQLVVTESRHRPLLDGLDLSLPLESVLDVDDPAYPALLDGGAPMPEREIAADALYLLVFTSGVSGRPKACRCSQGRLAHIGGAVVGMFDLTAADVCYAAMPLFHSNALMAGWMPAVVAGATVALRRRFSASAFLPDIRRLGATYFNYVGKPLSYILATPEKPDDADNPLRRVFGNEAAERDIDRFARRFGCHVVDSYGSTEGGISVQRVPGMPAGALGRAAETVAVLDPATGKECETAELDGSGRLLNPDAAVGELANRAGGAVFEGYYGDPVADAGRVRDGVYWSGDLGYRDRDGFFYFAGRADDWLRVDGENLATAPIARILGRHPQVLLAVVYGVPDPAVGDQVMAALQLRPHASFDPAAFAAFLEAQPDLGPKAVPRFVRVTGELPLTATSKVRVRELRKQAWRCADPVWWRSGAQIRFEPLSAERGAALTAEVHRRGGQLI